MGEFSDKVFEQVRRIPKGKVSTYGQIARLIGRPNAARFVGYALHVDELIDQDASPAPCHRVVFRDGALCTGAAFGGAGGHRKLLEAEGVTFKDADHVDMAACAWDPSEGAVGVMEGDLPMAPPEGFDWKRELGEEG